MILLAYLFYSGSEDGKNLAIPSVFGPGLREGARRPGLPQLHRLLLALLLMGHQGGD